LCRPGGADPFDSLAQPRHGRLGGNGRRRGSLQGSAPGRQVFHPEDQAPHGDVDREEEDREHEEDLADRPGGVHGRQRHSEGLRKIREQDPAASLRDRLERSGVGTQLAILG